MEGQRKRYTSEEKVAILKEHLTGRKPVSEACERHGIVVHMFYRSRQRHRPPSSGISPQSSVVTQPQHPPRLHAERVATPHA